MALSFMMQTGMMLGLLTSYPANWWRVYSLVASIQHHMALAS